MTELKKAKLLVYEKESQNDKTAREIVCLFNPGEYSIRAGVDYSQKHQQGKDETPPQYKHGQSSQLSLTLYFDSAGSTSDKSNLLDNEAAQPPVTVYTEEIAQLLKVDGDLHRPPVVAFLWGNFKFTGVIDSLNQSFTYFGIDGRPLRAKLDLTISAVPKTEADRVSPFSSPDRTKCRPLSEGMSLWQLAYEEYGDCEEWRLIAKANGLMNPLDVKTGQMLKLPALSGKE